MHSYNNQHILHKKLTPPNLLTGKMLTNLQLVARKSHGSGAK